MAQSSTFNLKPVNRLILLLLGTIFFTVLMIMRTSSVFAVKNNSSFIPANVINQINTNGQNMTPTNSIYKNTNGTGKVCVAGQPFVTGSAAWLSDNGDSTQSQNITMSEGSDSAQLQYNTVDFSCDADVDANGLIKNTAQLSKTKDRNLGTTVQITNSSGTIVGSPSVTTDFVSILKDWQTFVYFGNSSGNPNRFYTNSNDQIINRKINVAGLGGLAAGSYTITITIRHKMVNQFGWGSNPQFKCVFDPSVFTNDIDDTANKCITSIDVPITINLNILPGGSCTFVSVPSRIAPGQQFGATYTASNTSGGSWSIGPSGNYKLGSSDKYGNNHDSTFWGPKRVYIGNTNATLNAGASTTWSTAADAFTAPTTEGSYIFAWQVVSEITGWGGSTTTTWKGAPCYTTIRVVKPSNTPYLRSSTNDVWSGALFSVDANSLNCTNYTSSIITAAATAQISTKTAGTVDADSESALVVSRLYRAMLGRAPDAGSSSNAYWIRLYNDQGLSSVITAISGTPEYTGSAEALGNSAYDKDSDFVTKLYKNTFGRNNPSTSEVNYWAGLISSKTVTRKQAIAIFVQTTDIGAFGFGSYLSPHSNYGGAGAEYGAFSTGKIDIDQDGLTGFAGWNGSIWNRQGWRYSLLFANAADTYVVDPIPNPLPSMYGNYTNEPQCLPNYYDALKGVSKDVNSLADIQNLINTAGTNPLVINYSGGGSLGSLTIPAGKNITLLAGGSVNDTLTLSGNITYDAGYGTGNAPSIPSFTLVVRGDISISSAVSRLDGRYIAQPAINQLASGADIGKYTIESDSGAIKTCKVLPTSSSSIDPCNQKLTVNGSLIAQKINWNRGYGSIGYSYFGSDRGVTADINTASNDECLPLKGYSFNNKEGYDYLYYSGRVPASNTATGTQDGVGTVNQCAAEWINFSPEMYFSGNPLGIDSVEPQSFKELPPIY